MCFIICASNGVKKKKQHREGTRVSDGNRSVGRSSDIIIMNYDITNLENGLGYRASRTADVHLLKASAFFKSYKL